MLRTPKNGSRLRERLSAWGFGTAVPGDIEYQLKESNDSSHGVILDWLAELPPSRILDLGCSGGALAARARSLGHHVTGVDAEELTSVRERCDRFIQADLDRGLPPELLSGRPFDVVVCGDVLEHLRRPEQLLVEIRTVLARGGALYASVPNFGHWYPRSRTALGLFDYDQRGILDHGHVRFFTRRSFERLTHRAGFRPVRRGTTGLPLDALLASTQNGLVRAIRAVDRLTVRLRPTLFAYQLLYQFEVSASGAAAGAGNAQG